VCVRNDERHDVMLDYSIGSRKNSVTMATTMREIFNKIYHNSCSSADRYKILLCI